MCARTALFRDVLQMHNAASVISLRDMARTVFLGAVGSISEACVIVQLPRFIENFTFDSKTIPHGRTIACIDEGCLNLPRFLLSPTTTGMSQWGDSTCRALTHYTLMAQVESTHINSLIFRVKSPPKIHINFFFIPINPWIQKVDINPLMPSIHSTLASCVCPYGIIQIILFPKR